jgi:hypothetical protein
MQPLHFVVAKSGIVTIFVEPFAKKVGFHHTITRLRARIRGPSTYTLSPTILRNIPGLIPVTLRNTRVK